MTIIIAILALVGLLWAAIFATRGCLLMGCVGFVVVGYCLGHEFYQFDLGPIPLTLERVLLGGLIAAYVIQWRMGRTEPKQLQRADFVLFAFCGWLIISTFTNDWQLSKPGKISPIWLLVAGYIMPFLVYWIARQASLSQKAVYATYAAIALFGCYLAITALAEISHQWWLVYPKYISNPKLGIHFGRARGATLQSQGLGLMLSITLGVLWTWSRNQAKPKQLLVYLMLPVFLVAIYFTYTRCVWLGAAAGILVVMGFSLRGAWRPIAVTAVLGVGACLALYKADDIVGIQRDAGSLAARDSVSQRSSFTYVSWLMFQDRPLLGVGFGQFTEAKLPYLSDRSSSLYLEAIREQPHHNTFLSLLTETGIIGMLLFLAMLFYWIKNAWLMAKGPYPTFVKQHGVLMLTALACYLGPALFFDMTYSPQGNWLIFLLAGISSGLAAKYLPEKAVQYSALEQLRWKLSQIKWGHR